MNSIEGSLQDEIRDLMEELRKADQLYLPSPFWEEMANRHVLEIEKYGFENFKRTVNLKYFNWGLWGYIAQHSVPLLYHSSTSGDISPINAELVVSHRDQFSHSKLYNKIYAVFSAMLLQKVKKIDTDGLLDRIVEPPLGNPLLIKLGTQIFSQDLCNSVHEYYRSTSGFSDGGVPSKLPVLEIGAGYGRLAYIFLSANPGTRYWIVDIPPAINLSQRYLKEIFPELRIFNFRLFKHFSEVKALVEESDIAFFSANQISLLPSQSIDLSICISNLHEMTLDQIQHYLNEIDRLTKGYFYTKQWMKSITKSNGFTIRRDEYPFKDTWSTIFNKRHDIQSWFFEALFKCA